MTEKEVKAKIEYEYMKIHLEKYLRAGQHEGDPTRRRADLRARRRRDGLRHRRGVAAGPRAGRHKAAAPHRMDAG